MTSLDKAIGIGALLIAVVIMVFAVWMWRADCAALGGHLAKSIYGGWECVREVQGPRR